MTEFLWELIRSTALICLELVLVALALAVVCAVASGLAALWRESKRWKR